MLMNYLDAETQLTITVEREKKKFQKMKGKNARLHSRYKKTVQLGWNLLSLWKKKAF
jgi:hypothetical protein